MLLRRKVLTHADYTRTSNTIYGGNTRDNTDMLLNNWFERAANRNSCFKIICWRAVLRQQKTVNSNEEYSLNTEYDSGNSLIRLLLEKITHIKNTTRASNWSFYPFFNKRFDHLETLLAIHTPKKVLSARSLCGSLAPVPYAPKGPLYYPKSITLQFQIYYHSHLNIS